LLIFPLRIEPTIAQNPQPRQTPTTTPTNPRQITPTNPADDFIEEIDPEQGEQNPQPRQTPTATPTTPVKPTPTTPTDDFIEEIDPEEAEQKADQLSPKNQQNPFVRPDIDKLLTEQFNDDMWRIMRGGLPCLETTSACLDQLQSKAVAGSPLLKELDTRIQEANDQINDARSRNAKTVRLSILTPALQYLLGPTPTPGQPQQRGLIDNLLGVFRGDTGLINGLLNVIGIPFFQGSQGANTEANRNSIAIADLQVKVAELQRARAQLADTTREKVAISLVKFDESRTDFQVAQVVGARAVDQFKVFELRYIRGNNDTESYLAKQSQLDKTKADTYSAWAKMRRSLFEIKLLVLGVKDAEI
jgi:hypothetical protein